MPYLRGNTNEINECYLVVVVGKRHEGLVDYWVGNGCRNELMGSPLLIRWIFNCFLREE